MNSNYSRFRISSFIQMARITDNAEKREEYIAIAEKELNEMKESFNSETFAVKQSEAEAFILDFLSKGERKTEDLDSEAYRIGISRNTLGRAKTALSKSKILVTRSEGFGKNKVFFSKLC